MMLRLPDDFFLFEKNILFGLISGIEKYARAVHIFQSQKLLRENIFSKRNISSGLQTLSYQRPLALILPT